MSDEIHQEMLAELRKIRRSSQAGMYFALVMVSTFVAYMAWRQVSDIGSGKSRPNTTITSGQKRWADVNAAIDRQNFHEALSLAQRLVAQDTDYYYGHSYLRSIYMALGDLTNAESSFLRAYELYPDEDNEKSLAAVRKRLRGDLNASKVP
jgi:tetratricopeptide (TPR) repeat protein